MQRYNITIWERCAFVSLREKFGNKSAVSLRHHSPERAAAENLSDHFQLTRASKRRLVAWI